MFKTNAALLRQQLTRQMELTSESHEREAQALGRWRSAVDQLGGAMAGWHAAHAETVRLGAEVEHLNRVLDQRADMIARQAAEIDNCTHEIGAVKGQFDELARQNRGLRANNEGLQAALGEARAAQATAEANAATLAYQAQQAAQAVADLTAQVDQLTAQLAERDDAAQAAQAPAAPVEQAPAPVDPAPILGVISGRSRNGKAAASASQGTAEQGQV